MPSILVVDDEPANLDLLEGVLSPAGYTVRAASSGLSALQAVKEDLPDLILLDLMMPGMSGFEVCERLRAEERTARIPVIIVTALGRLGIKERVLALGADDYLTKPIQPDEVLARVEAMMRVRHLREDLDRTLAYLHELEVARHAHRRRMLAGISAAAVEPPRVPEGQAAPVVLLVDDEGLTRLFYGDLLTEHGFQVVAVARGEEALAEAPRYPFEAVVLDLMLPEMSGLETLERLRKPLPDVPVIILTAHPTSQRAIAALKLGAFDFIVKGLQHDLVILAVRRAVRRFADLRQQKQVIANLEARIRELEARLSK